MNFLPSVHLLPSDGAPSKCNQFCCCMSTPTPTLTSSSAKPSCGVLTLLKTISCFCAVYTCVVTSPCCMNPPLIKRPRSNNKAMNILNEGERVTEQQQWLLCRQALLPSCPAGWVQDSQGQEQLNPSSDSGAKAATDPMRWPPLNLIYGLWYDWAFTGAVT